MLKEHPLRRPLSEEIHTRPPAEIIAPATISHIACLSGEGSRKTDRAHLEGLCRHYKVAPPAKDATHFRADFGRFQLKWERHTEFSTFTFIRAGKFEQPFKDTVIEEIPEDWLSTLPGDVIAAVHIAVVDRLEPDRSPTDLAGLFDNNPLTGGEIVGGRAKLWTDYRVHTDGFHRFLIKDDDLSPATTGRVVQRLVEIETYRMMAILAFPIARDSRARVTEAEKTLSDIIARLETISGDDGERQLLNQLSSLAAEAESIAVATTYRFSAARAYYALIQERMKAMREERLSGHPPAMEFLHRRLAPAMETCENLSRRLESLSGRIGRASALLRTRVDVSLEAQNRDLLNSMDRRARLQLRLQQTVEGLSVVAISYYLLSLVSYLAKGAKNAGLWPVDPYVVVGVAFPFVFGGIWYGVRKVRRSIEKSVDGF